MLAITIESISQTLSSWVWSPALVVLCLCSALYFSIRTRFVQVSRFGEMAKLLFYTDKTQKTGISSFQAFSVYVDTLLVCTATAVMIMAVKTYNVMDVNTGEVLFASSYNLGAPDVSYTATAIGTLLGADLGNIIVAVALAFFAFTTIMAYYYYAETSLVYLFGNGRKEHAAIWVLRICILVAVIFGSVKEARVAWNVGDIGVGAMAWINIIVILLLSPQALRTLKDYERQQKEGREPEFNPRKLDIRNADFWDDSTKD